MSLMRENMISERENYSERAANSFQPKKRGIILGDNDNCELDQNVKLYLDDKFNNLEAKINNEISRPEFLEHQLKEFKTEISDMLDIHTRNIHKLITDSHKQILETVESKFNPPTTNIANTEPSILKVAPPSKARVYKKTVVRKREFDYLQSLNTAIRSYVSKLDKMGQGWDLKGTYSLPSNKKVTTVITDYIVNNPDPETLKRPEYNRLEHQQKIEIIRDKTRNYYYNLRLKMRNEGFKTKISSKRQQKL